jgi:hypothetical protein
MKAQHLALRLPEIVREVLQQLHDDKAALYAAIRVSRMWFDAGVGELWRDVSWPALRGVERTREQFYADKITRLHVHRDEPPESRPTLPRLRALEAGAEPSDQRFPYVLQLIGPGLAELSCTFSASVSEHVIALGCMPRLRRLKFFGSDPDEYCDGLDSFVAWMTPQSLPALTQFELSYLGLGSGALVDQLLCTCAQFPLLMRLELGDVSPEAQPATFRKIWASTYHTAGPDQGNAPFPRLRELALRVDCDAVPVWAERLPSLTRLRLELEEAHGVFPAIASLTRLEELDLILGEEASVEREDLLALQRLALLRSFRLLSDNPQSIRAADADLVLLLTSWRMLETLMYEVDVVNSPNLLGHIGLACPSLVNVGLQGAHCLDCAFGGAGLPPSLFPRLENLHLFRLYANHTNCVRYVSPMFTLSRYV